MAPQLCTYSSTHSSDSTATILLPKKTTSQTLRVATLNIQNARANCIYLRRSLQWLDFVCLQEHWLFIFEAETLLDLFPTHNFAVKCADDSDPISPKERKRGHGGVAIGWKNNHNHAVKTLEDGSCRTIAIEIHTQDRPICLINTYLPSRGRGHSTEDFNTALDEVSEIVEKFSNSHLIVLMGDFNSSLHRDPPNNHDYTLRKQLKKSILGPHNHTQWPPPYFTMTVFTMPK